MDTSSKSFNLLIREMPLSKDPTSGYFAIERDAARPSLAEPRIAIFDQAA
jgi:hypothetical protein